MLLQSYAMIFLVTKNYKVFFDNWLTRLDLLHDFISKGIYAVGTIRLNRLRGCSLGANKNLVPKDILASHWYGKDQCLDPIPSSLS